MEPGVSASADREPDPITQEVIKNGLRSIANEMVISVLRTAHSSSLREGMDCSTALFDRHGRIVAQGVTLAVHLGAMPDALEFVLRKYAGDIEPGDAFIVNDPDEGGMHLPDVFLFRSVHLDGEIIGFTGTVAHQKDVGGRVAGSIAPDSTDIFQEGLQIPVLKVLHGGRDDEAVFEIIRRNVRFPETVIGDLRAQLAACFVGAEALVDLVRRHGVHDYEMYVERAMDATAAIVRHAIAAIPDGSYSFTDHLDSDGFGSGPVALAVTVTVHGDTLHADFDGTSPQVRSALNATTSVCKAAIYTALQCCIDVPDILDDAGAHQGITVHVPEGTILNPLRPAARGSRGLTIFRLLDVVFGALHQAMPDRVPAAGDGGIDLMLFSGNDDAGRLHVSMDAISAGWGGSPFGDGLDGVSCLFANLANCPVEILESTSPLRVEHYGFVPDSGGPGENRGCVAVRRRYRYLLPEGDVHIRADRRLHPPYGLAGGRSGRPGRTTRNDAVTLPAMGSVPLEYGDVIDHTTAGGGGFGDPWHRDPGLVLDDVLDGKVTVGGALADYGVFVDVTVGLARRTTSSAGGASHEGR